MTNFHKLILAVIVLVSASVGVRAQEITPPAEINALLQKHTCLACHKTGVRLVGPAYTDVAKKKYTNEQIVELIYAPKPSNWPGYPAMAAIKSIPKDDALKVAAWINSLAGPAKKGGSGKGKTKKA